MSAKRLVDVRGLYCPEPVINVKAAMKEIDTGTIEVLVDCGASVENVSRMAGSNGWAIAVEDLTATEKRLTLTR